MFYSEIKKEWKWWRIILIISPFLLFVACGHQGTPMQHEGQVVTQEKQDTTSKNTSKNLTFNLGQDIKLRDFVVRVNKVVDYKDYKFDYGCTVLKKGNKFVAIEVEYFNSSQDIFRPNLGVWTLFDNENYSYGYDDMLQIINGKTPKLSSTIINPGGKLKGWITFEILQSSTPKKVQFGPIINNADGDEIIVEINLDKTSK